MYDLGKNSNEKNLHITVQFTKNKNMTESDKPTIFSE